MSRLEYLLAFVLVNAAIVYDQTHPGKVPQALRDLRWEVGGALWNHEMLK